MRFPSLLAIALLAPTSATLAAPTNDRELGQSSSNTEREQAATAFKTEGELPTAVPKLKRPRPAFGEHTEHQTKRRPDFRKPPVTEEQLEETRRLPIRFVSEKLSALLEQEFVDKVYSDPQIREAIKAEDAKQLYDLIKCPICCDCLHSETLATTDCLHEAHQVCLDRNYSQCPICNDFGLHKDKHRETLLKKSLELFELEGWIPPKPPTGVYSSLTKEEQFTNVMMGLLAAHIRLAERIIREVRNAISGNRDAQNLSSSTGWRDHLITELNKGSAIPRAIWGVTVFDKKRPPPTSLLALDDASTTAEFLRILSRIRAGFRHTFAVSLADVPSFVNVAPDVQLNEHEILVGRLSSPVRAVGGVLQRTKSPACGNSERVNAPPAAKVDISESVVSWLHSLEDTAHDVRGGVLLKMKATLLEKKKDFCMDTIRGLHELVDDRLVGTIIIIESERMLRYKAQFRQLKLILENAFFDEEFLCSSVKELY